VIEDCVVCEISDGLDCADGTDVNDCDICLD
jgi:hypothetical protein